jgi:hypothetical protein
MDAKPERRLVYREGSEKVDLVDTYQAHFATCKDADSWRRKM